MEVHEEIHAREALIRLIQALKNPTKIGLQELQVMLVIKGFSCAGVDLITQELQGNRIQITNTIDRLKKKKLIQLAPGVPRWHPGVRYALTQKALLAVESITSEASKAIKRAAPYGRLRAGKKTPSP